MITWRGNKNILHWRHNDHDGVSNHQHHGCLPNRLFGRRSKRTSQLHVTGLCAGNLPGPVNSPHKAPVTRKMFPFDDVIMTWWYNGTETISALLDICGENPSVTGITKGQWCPPFVFSLPRINCWTNNGIAADQKKTRFNAQVTSMLFDGEPKIEQK